VKIRRRREPWPVLREVTGRRLAAADRFNRREVERYALFADQVELEPPAAEQARQDSGHLVGVLGRAPFVQERPGVVADVLGKAKLIPRELPEIRHAIDREVTRLRWEHEVRIGDEPVSLTSLGNALIDWYLSLPPKERDRIILPAAMALDAKLRQPAPGQEPAPEQAAAGSSPARGSDASFPIDHGPGTKDDPPPKRTGLPLNGGPLHEKKTGPKVDPPPKRPGRK
jgi:hypothetical protein